MQNKRWVLIKIIQHRNMLQLEKVAIKKHINDGSVCKIFTFFMGFFVSDFVFVCFLFCIGIALNSQI